MRNTPIRPVRSALSIDTNPLVANTPPLATPVIKMVEPLTTNDSRSSDLVDAASSSSAPLAPASVAADKRQAKKLKRKSTKIVPTSGTDVDNQAPSEGNNQPEPTDEAINARPILEDKDIPDDETMNRGLLTVGLNPAPQSTTQENPIETEKDGVTTEATIRRRNTKGKNGKPPSQP